ncbi:CDP-alcohol phosphatidyltransferase family protein [Halococcus sp. IIIV-5B]|nr:CDP-alcohol phosphatidyltransferase family protein [Halococcus sp. IIIV-5B]
MGNVVHVVKPVDKNQLLARRETHARGRLRTQWFYVACIAVGIAVAGWVVLSEWWQPIHGIQWLGLTGFVLTYELWLLWRHIGRNRRSNTDQLFESLGAGTAATLLRGIAIAAVAGFILIPQPTGPEAWLPAGIYGLAVALDWVDGRLARWSGQPTLLGAKLDREFDGLGLLVAGLLGYAYGVLPVWYLAVGFARPLFVVGTWLHRHRGGTIGSLPESGHRRQLAGSQMIVCSVALLPVVTPTVSMALATVVMLPFVGVFIRDFITIRE